MKIVVMEPLGVAEGTLRQQAEELLGKDAALCLYDSPAKDAAELVERGADADVIVIANHPFPREAVEGCKNLKMLCVAFTGVDHVALDACREKGVVVSNCAGYSTEAVAELVFGMALTLYRDIISADNAVRRSGTRAGLTALELAGKKFGVIGTGAIGLRVAELAKAFGCRVYGCSRTVKPEAGIRYLSLRDLLSTCDVVSIHVPLTDETRGMIGKEQLSWMKPTAILINTARGPIVNSADQAEALKEGRLAGAAVDVFEKEPPLREDHPLLRCPNVVAAPHVGFATQEALERRSVIAFENIAAWVRGCPQNVVK